MSPSARGRAERDVPPDNGQMISVDRAERLRAAGLRWHPRSGDRFVIRRADVDDEVYTISDMMIEAHDFSTGTVLGFNGTTEWALDSVAKDDALWLPGEEQLRELLGGTFRQPRARVGWL
jgi:hypothetical protein